MLPVPLELALLRILERQPSLSWHQVATRLSSMEVPRQPDMMVALKALVHEEFVERDTSGETDQWSLTETGEGRLRFLQSLKESRTPVWVDTGICDAVTYPRALPERMEPVAL